jgi:hypothetical protein
MTGIAAASRPLVARVGDRITSPSDVLLATRIIAWAFVLPLLKRVLPLPRLVLLVRRRGGASTRRARREDQIVTFARWACRLTRWPSGGNCLERSLVAYRFLAGVNADPWLVVGIGSDGRAPVQGHAWVVVDGHPVGESVERLRDFACVVAFRPDGSVEDATTWRGPTR